MKITTTFLSAAVLGIFVTASAIAQTTDPLRPFRGICRSSALASLERRNSTLNTLCDRNQTRLARLQTQKTERDQREQEEIDRLEALYGVQITRCSNSMIDVDPGDAVRYDTALCSVIDEPGLDRAESLLQVKLRAARNRRLRDALFSYNIGRVNQVCERARDARASAIWLRAQCGSLRAGQ